MSNTQLRLKDIQGTTFDLDFNHEVSDGFNYYEFQQMGYYDLPKIGALGAPTFIESPQQMHIQNEMQKFYVVELLGVKTPNTSTTEYYGLDKIGLRSDTGVVVIIDDGGNVIPDIAYAQKGTAWSTDTYEVNAQGCVTLPLNEVMTTDETTDYFIVYKIPNTHNLCGFQRFPANLNVTKIGLKLYNDESQSDTFVQYQTPLPTITIYPTSSLIGHLRLNMLYAFGQMIVSQQDILPYNAVISVHFD